MTFIPAATPARVRSIDILRGIVMVIMALDHTRDFFYNSQYEPTDVAHASAILFFTRWITHYCAPTFVFLSGTSAFLASRKNGNLRQTSWRLLTRGVWLILLELTIVYFGWSFEPSHSRIILQVIWALGCSMVFLSALVFLPWQAILAIGLALILGHNAFDWYTPPPDSSWHFFWHILHIQGPVVLDPNHTLMIFYPIVPWIGVMATGYVAGKLFTLPPLQRNKYLSIIGVSCMALFLILRLSNIYGDPLPWHTQVAWWRTLLSVLNTTKYPPSLLYLLMTIGPGLALMPALEKMSTVPATIFTVYGRVPMFYYVLHIYLIHLASLLFSQLFRHGAPVGMMVHPGYALYVVYLTWLTVVALLYLPCRWFMGVKKRNSSWWLSYL